MQTLKTALSVEEAIACFARIEGVRPKRVPLDEAIGYRVAEDVMVKRPLPAEAVAALDGWALSARETSGASRRSPKLLTTQPRAIDRAHALPPGSNAIAPLDFVSERGRGMYAQASVDAGEGVSATGSEAPAGKVLIPGATRLTFASAMAAALCGVTDVRIRRPVVDIVFNSPGRFGPNEQIVRMSASAIRASGAQIGALQFTHGDGPQFARALTESSADMICTIGGTGRGPGDTTVSTIAEVGTVVFHGVRLKPGGTCAFGMVGGRPVFAAPGGLADMLAVNIVMTPAFARRMFGRPPGTPALREAKLTCGLPGAPNASMLRLAHLADKAITPILKDSLTPLDIASANAAIFVPEGRRHRRKGETVPYILLGTAM